jgi:hypothetical protein
MSWPHIIAARSTPPAGLTPGARHVLLVIATYTNDTGRAWAGLDTIAADTGYHPASIRRLVELLAKSTDGLVIPRPGKSHLFDLAPTARPPRALGAPPRALGHDEQTRTVLNQRARAIACSPVGDIPPAAPAAWARIADPVERAEALARFEQMRLEV